jgi:hypothetical protein
MELGNLLMEWANIKYFSISISSYTYTHPLSLCLSFSLKINIYECLFVYRPPSEAEEYYIRAATMYETALQYAPAVSDGHYLYVLRKETDLTKLHDIVQFPIQNLDLHNPISTSSENKTHSVDSLNLKSSVHPISSSLDEESKSEGSSKMKHKNKLRSQKSVKHRNTLSWNEFELPIEHKTLLSGSYTHNFNECSLDDNNHLHLYVISISLYLFLSFVN